MLGEVLEGLTAFLHFSALFYLVLGTIIGFIIGIIPGLGGNFLLAVLIPFVFKMAPVDALALLIGASSPTCTSGSISAILFGVPGTGENAVTMFDGFPLGQKGEAGRAIGAATTSSGLGGLFGAIILLLLVPVLKPVVLSFGPPEFFMLIMVGLIFIGGLGEGSTIKGMIAGLLGLIFSLFGMDIVSGEARYTFGQLYLWEGIKLIPVVLGLFAITEMIDLSLSGGSLAKIDVKAEKNKSYNLSLGAVFSGVKDVFKYWFLFLRCSMIGTIIGIIPGLGGTVAAFMAYGHGLHTAKERKKFGQGAIEGVIAPEAANNAKEGGAFVPTLGFGVPGSSVMAILLGAFMIIGIQPGPELLNNQTEIIYSIVWLCALSNLLAAVMGIFLAKYLARLTFVRGSLLVPSVLVFTALGAYGYRGTYADIVVALIFGIIGWGMKKYKYPRPALILGLVLGQLAEKHLLISLDLYGKGFILRPISFSILMIILASLGWPAIRKLMKKS